MNIAYPRFARTLLCLGAFVFAGFSSAAQDAAEAPVARVVAVRGQVEIRRAGDQAQTAALKAALRVGDVVATGTLGRVQLSFSDGSIISLGRETTVEITRYKYDPANSKGEMSTTVRQGLFRVLGGAITKIAPGNFKTHTPTATIGVRGSYFVGTATGTLTRVAFLGGMGIYLENEFGRLDLAAAGAMGEAGGEAPPSGMEDGRFLGKALEATGAGGDNGQADGDDDDNGGGAPAGGAQWEGADGAGGSGGPGAAQEPDRGDDRNGLTPDQVVDPDDGVNKQIDQVARVLPWNGVSVGLDHLGSWFDTPTSEAFELQQDTRANTVEGDMRMVATENHPEQPAFQTAKRHVDKTTWQLPIAVKGASPFAEMGLSLDPSEASSAKGEGLAQPFPSGGGTWELPEYLSWGEWNMDLYDPNAPDATVPEGAIAGFYVLGRQAPAELVDLGAREALLGQYYGPAAAGRFKDGAASRYEGHSELTVDFSARAFYGELNFNQSDTGDLPLVIGVEGEVHSEGFDGWVSRLTEGVSRAESVPVSIEESAVKGVFYGSEGPDALGGVFRASSPEAHWLGNFVGAEAEGIAGRD